MSIKVKMLAQNRELQFGCIYDLPDGRANGLINQGFAKEYEEPAPPEPTKEANAKQRKRAAVIENASIEPPENAMLSNGSSRSIITPSVSEPVSNE